MNEKLESKMQECLDGFIDNPTRSYFKASIHYFYNLALNDVKEETEKKIDYLKEAYERGDLSDYGKGGFGYLLEIRNFIDILLNNDKTRNSEQGV